MQPVLVRKDTLDTIQFRIRNLPYPAQVYSVSISQPDQTHIIVRTSNKKYYKKIGISDITEIGETLSEENLQWTHRNNTLMIQYSKPEALLEAEEKARHERAHLQFNDEGEMKSNECKQQ